MDATGLYYFNARYYDPETGRFITKTPPPLLLMRGICMTLTLLEILQFTTFVAFLIVAGFFFSLKDFLFSFLFLGVAVLYLVFRNRKSYLSFKEELTTTESATRLATAWMGILIVIVFLIMEVPNPYWMLVVPVPLGLLFLWMVLTGR